MLLNIPLKIQGKREVFVIFGKQKTHQMDVDFLATAQKLLSG